MYELANHLKKKLLALLSYIAGYSNTHLKQEETVVYQH